ncbi:hydroxymethylpyrimidine/phosphomethylpyrimidine kinase [Chitinophaga sp. SYP-B3965]|uniref:hydroxymethylpyrimidine/phosphomethylpyrimidine kinase n=1 Tax=Chitinophaga sp. SYP-B3965 TaxID=2663120 RepID=UPI001299AF3C|nr:hydroxymethylpyrimidine/phosphomethylpyrimidine kinase [Chitinophaga sp. SYP-B3965]MRG46577.1 hydroxymethylpyrimidine/phosphomethylpyrimidine kinase [Chitinophaga sp. SYP-B3965]
MEPYVMSLAGLDPTGGAGLLADIKTFEAHRLNGLGVCTALTAQTDDEFLGVEWIPAEKILAQALPLLEKFPVSFCKVGVVSHPSVLLEVLPALRNARPGIQFILDPVLKASAGYVFHTAIFSQWEMVLDHILLLTPNYEEAIAMSGLPCGESAARKMSSKCAILLKGGHRADKPGWDTLYAAGAHVDFAPVTDSVPPKHGSGCVLSAAITSSLAKGLSLTEACQAGKDYTLRYLQSSEGLLGHHTL